MVARIEIRLRANGKRERLEGLRRLSECRKIERAVGRVEGERGREGAWCKTEAERA